MLVSKPQLVHVDIRHATVLHYASLSYVQLQH